MNDLYGILGISKNSDQDMIKRAYRKLASKWHPDKNSSTEATDKFQQIEEAYRILSDPAKKSQYDMGIDPRKPQQAHQPQDINDILRSVFGGGFGNGYHTTSSHSTVYQVTLSLKEAFTGCNKKVVNQVIKIPPGIRSNSMLKFNDALINIRILPDQKYQRQNDDLYLDTPVHAAMAMTGGDATLTHIDGNEYTVKIPSGVQEGNILRLKGKGMPNPEIPGKIGDLFLRFRIIVPNNLTQEQKDVIVEMFKLAELKL